MAFGLVSRKRRQDGETVQSRVKYVTNADYVMTPADTTVYVTISSSTNSAITLPSVSEAAGGIFVIKAPSVGSGTVTISDKAGDAAFGDVSLTFTGEYTVLYSDGFTWFTLDSSLSLS